MRLVLRFIGCLLGFLVTSPLFAIDLKGVVEDAKRYDTDYLTSQSTFASVEQDVVIAQSALLPQLSLGGQYTYNDHKKNSIQETGKSYQYGLSLDQKLFDLGAWGSLSKAHIAYQQALVSREAAKQQMLYSVASGYFAVLTAISNLDSERSEVKALKSQYDQVRHRFKAGVVAKPDLYAAKSQYLLEKANMMSAKASARHAVDQLTNVTGKRYDTFNFLGRRLAPKRPVPNNRKSWQDLALKNNLSLMVAEKSVEMAKQAIAIGQASGMPTLSLQATYSHSKPWIPGGGPANEPFNIGTVLLKASWGVFTGGHITASVEQLRLLHAEARQSVELARRHAITQARSTFFDVQVDIDQIQASYQALRASRVSLKALRDGYKVGTQTLTDVLQGIYNSHKARLQFISARYKYLQDVLLLRFTVGALHEQDLDDISKLLINKRTFKG